VLHPMARAHERQSGEARDARDRRGGRRYTRARVA
jgi:hypothetical protein